MENYKNNICIVGKDVNIIKKELNLYKDDNRKKIENFWDIISCNDWNNITEILKGKITAFKEGKFSFTIIVSLSDLDNEQKVKINELFRNLENDLIEDIISEYYFPFIIFLVHKEKDIIDLKKELIQYSTIDERNISYFISPLKKDANKEKNIELIKLKIYKIYSYFCELGYILEYEDQTIKLYKESLEDFLPVNALVIGKTQVGKSTIINAFLKEKRAKEGNNASNETEKLSTYHIDEIPLLLNE